MSRSEIVELVAVVTGLEPGSITTESGLDNNPEWDSLAHIAIFTELEHRFARKFSSKEIIQARTLNDICLLLGLSDDGENSTLK